MYELHNLIASIGKLYVHTKPPFVFFQVLCKVKPQNSKQKPTTNLFCILLAWIGAPFLIYRHVIATAFWCLTHLDTLLGYTTRRTCKKLNDGELVQTKRTDSGDTLDSMGQITNEAHSTRECLL